MPMNPYGILRECLRIPILWHPQGIPMNPYGIPLEYLGNIPMNPWGSFLGIPMDPGPYHFLNCYCSLGIPRDPTAQEG